MCYTSSPCPYSIIPLLKITIKSVEIVFLSTDIGHTIQLIGSLSCRWSEFHHDSPLMVLYCSSSPWTWENPAKKQWDMSCTCSLTDLCSLHWTVLDRSGEAPSTVPSLWNIPCQTICILVGAGESHKNSLVFTVWIASN
jgi:hypothetical protein